MHAYGTAKYLKKELDKNKKKGDTYPEFKKKHYKDE